MKTEVMAMAFENNEVNMITEDQTLEQLDPKYCGSILTWNGRCTDIIRSRIAFGKIAFSRVRNVLVTRGIGVKLRKRFAKCFMWSIVIYPSERWTIRNRGKKCLESFEIWLWRKVEKISGKK